MVNMEDMITDIIYLSKYTIHTGSDEADFSYSLKGLDKFQKSLLIRIIDTLLEVVEPQGDKGSTSANYQNSSKMILERNITCLKIIKK